MSHLHIPDGVLPPWLWLGGWIAVLLLLWRVGRRPTARQIVTRATLGGWMLAAMALPTGALDFHLSLAGPVGILLGAAGGLEVAFTVNAILAFVGHGGFTTVGLNALLSGASAAVAALAYRLLAPRARPEWAMAGATGLGQLVAGGLWLTVVLVAAHTAPAARAAGHDALIVGVALPLWLAGTVAEAAVAWGIGRFIARVSPSLLPLAPVVGPWGADAEGDAA